MTDFKIDGLQLIAPSEPIPPKNTITVIYGQPGSGKTSLSFTANNPLHLDFDDGLERAVGRKMSIKFTSVIEDGELKKTGYEACKELIDSGKFLQLVDQYEFKTIVIDTGGTLLDDHIAPYLIHNNPKYGNSAGGLTLQGYGALKQEYKTLLRTIKGFNLDIVVVCHATEKDGKHRPKMTGGSLEVLKESCDLLGYLFLEGNKRTLDFNPTESHFGKNVAGFKRLNIPHYESEKYLEFVANCIRIAKEKMSSISEEQKSAINDVAEYKAQVEQAETFKELTAIEIDANKLPTTYKVQVKTLVLEKFNSMYAEMYWDGLEDAEAYTQALLEIPENVDQYKSRQLGYYFFDFAKLKGYTYDKENKVMVLDESVAQTAEQAVNEKPAAKKATAKKATAKKKAVPKKKANPKKKTTAKKATKPKKRKAVVVTPEIEEE